MGEPRSDMTADEAVQAVRGCLADLLTRIRAIPDTQTRFEVISAVNAEMPKAQERTARLRAEVAGDLYAARPPEERSVRKMAKELGLAKSKVGAMVAEARAAGADGQQDAPAD